MRSRYFSLDAIKASDFFRRDKAKHWPLQLCDICIPLFRRKRDADVCRRNFLIAWSTTRHLISDPGKSDQFDPMIDHITFKNESLRLIYLTQFRNSILRYAALCIDKII